MIINMEIKYVDKIYATIIQNDIFILSCFRNLPSNIAKVILMPAASSISKQKERLGEIKLRCSIKFTKPLRLQQHSMPSPMF